MLLSSSYILVQRKNCPETEFVSGSNIKYTFKAGKKQDEKRRLRDAVRSIDSKGSKKGKGKW
jgi:hypothetical protein